MKTQPRRRKLQPWINTHKHEFLSNRPPYPCLSEFILGCLLFLLLTSLVSAADELPVTRVVLFTSGVGFLQREGEVTGNASVELSFRTDQINDLLKSLVLQDLGGGKIAPVVFGSRDPLEHTLKSFAIDITDNPPLGELLNRMRGVEAQITAPKEIKGIIVGVETQHKVVTNQDIMVFVLNLLTDEGLRAYPLDQVQQIKILDPALDKELHDALKVLAANRDTQHKPLALSFTGTARR